jgi:hypothetical protein
VDWYQNCDHLRCNPCFHGEPRYDSILIPTLNAAFFGRLLFMFTFSVGGSTYPLALIQPYEVISDRSRLRADKDLGLLRVEKKKAPELISLHSILRGALLVPTELNNDKQFFVVDVIDVDMFYRVKQMFSGYTEI